MRDSEMRQRKRVAFLGSVGVPAQYGGFETLAENLVLYARDHVPDCHVEVYCSGKAYSERPDSYEGADLRYIPLSANGPWSLFYDMWSMIDAVWRGVDDVVLLGHGGSFVIPLLKPFSKARFLTNIDGIEWKRDKWTGLARWVLRQSERAAIRHSHVVIADNDAIQDYVTKEYGAQSVVIPYGGDHALAAEPDPQAQVGLPENYVLALCRIEPENNVAMILEAFSGLDRPLVFVGNWDKSDYGRKLKDTYKNCPNILLRDPVYEPHSLRAIRDGATAYVHGHSAGGTNPSLVEMMHFGIPVLAHGCLFNRYATEEKAVYFDSVDELRTRVTEMTPAEASRIGDDMVEIARRRYLWSEIGQAYFGLIAGSLPAKG